MLSTGAVRTESLGVVTSQVVERFASAGLGTEEEARQRWFHERTSPLSFSWSRGCGPTSAAILLRHYGAQEAYNNFKYDISSFFWDAPGADDDRVETARDLVDQIADAVALPLSGGISQSEYSIVETPYSVLSNYKPAVKHVIHPHNYGVYFFTMFSPKLYD